MNSSEMEYDKSQVYKELLESSRLLAEDIMNNIRRLGLDVNFTMDDLTLADGNCFFRGIMQQCRRSEVYCTLSDEVKEFVDTMDHYGFRKWIKDCVFVSNHVRVQQETLQPFLPEQWDYYWSDGYMMKNGFWADSIMVRCTAWFLKKDLMIISEDNDDLQCVTTISGNMDENTAAIGPQLYLGFARNHYQSILPVDADAVPDDCPCCKKTYKSVLIHVIKSKACKEFVGEKLIGKWREINSEKSNKKMRKNYYDSGKHKEYQDSYVKSGKHKQIQANHLAKKKEQDPEGLRATQKKWNQTQRYYNDENARNRNFLENSKFGPIFICICCHRKLSRGNVIVFNESVESKIKIPLVDCIFDMDVYTNVIEFRNGKEVSPNNRYIYHISNIFSIVTSISF